MFSYFNTLLHSKVCKVNSGDEQGGVTLGGGVLLSSDRMQIAVLYSHQDRKVLP